jgi:hypothetical protein
MTDETAPKKLEEGETIPANSIEDFLKSQNQWRTLRDQLKDKHPEENV